jgi:hypothetical protein
MTRARLDSSELDLSEGTFHSMSRRILTVVQIQDCYQLELVD